MSGVTLPRGRVFASSNWSGALRTISERSLNKEVAYRSRGPWASLSPFRADWLISLLVSRDLTELLATVGCLDELGASRNGLKIFLGRIGLLCVCTTKLEVGLEKIGGFVTVAPAGDPCGLVDDPLTVTERLLWSWLVVLLFKGLLGTLGEAWPLDLDGENRERRFFRRYSRGKLM